MADIPSAGAGPDALVPDDPFQLQRFVDAQDGVHEQALTELRAGKKRTHWMWFVFPQLRGLGSSSMAQRYGVASLDEARAYLAHPVLGRRLQDVTMAVLESPGSSVTEIFGSPDDVKFRSSMTLFASAAQQNGNLFRRALAERCGGVSDEKTLAMLGREGEAAGRV